MEQQQEQKIEGVVQNVIYQNKDNGWTVARVDTGGGDLVITGSMPYLGAGETIAAYGVYVTHPEYGPQFNVTAYERVLPSTAAGIYDYLASRAVKGIGAKTAQAIVERFGEDTFDVLANYPEKLTEIRGMSLRRAQEIQQNFLQNNAMRGLLEFFTSHKLPLWCAAGVYKLYGPFSLEKLQQDPYLLCEDRFGLDFSQVDEAAARMGIDALSPVRLQAALLYELAFNLQSGHCFIPREKLAVAAASLCEAPAEELDPQIDALLEQQRAVEEQINGRPMVYLTALFRQENTVAREVVRLLRMRLEPPPNLEQLIRQAEKDQGIDYANKQRQALSLCFRSALSLITGGPGTGKTTAILGILSMLRHYGLTVALCAPTGRAAKKMSELCGEEAKTLHRMLEAAFSPEDGVMKFKRGRDNPLQADVIIVDEASMLDLSLASSLLEAMKPHARLVLIGDADQLPPVWAGSVFADLLACDFVPQVRLTEIFRQAQGSQIVMNAHRINRGLLPDLRRNQGDFYFSSAATPEAAVETVATLVARRIPNHFHIEPQNIQVVCPTRQQMCGSVSLNQILQSYLNPPAEDKPEARCGQYTFRLGDRVMQVKNNYDILWQSASTAEVGAGIFNGDTGVITLIDPAEQVLVVRFDEKEAAYSFDDLFQLEPAYAITAHKAQGSEYEAVIIPVFQAPARLLNRSILYTAVTRAKRLLVLVGRAAVVKQMVETNHKNRRYSALKYRLRSYYEAVSDS